MKVLCGHCGQPVIDNTIAHHPACFGQRYGYTDFVEVSDDVPNGTPGLANKTISILPVIRALFPDDKNFMEDESDG